MMSDQDNVVPPSRSGGIASRGIIAMVVIGAMALFIYQNAQSVPFHFLFIDFQIAVWLLISISFVLGMILDNVVMGMFRRVFRRGKTKT